MVTDSCHEFVRASKLAGFTTAPLTDVDISRYICTITLVFNT